MAHTFKHSMSDFCGPHPQLAIPESFDLCLSYEEQVAYLADKVDKLEKKVEEIENKLLTNDA